MTSSPCSKKAVKTEYWPGGGRKRVDELNGTEGTFISPTRDENLRVDTELSTEQRIIKTFDSLPQADAAFGV